MQAHKVGRGVPSKAGIAEDRSLVALRSTLTEGRDHFDAIADVMPHFVWLAEADGTITFFNRRWLQYTGLTVGAMTSPGVKGVVHPADLDETQKRWNNALQTGTSYEIEYRLRNVEDGSYRWFLARAMPVMDESGRNARWIGTATDIDEQKRSRESLEFVLKAVNAFGSSLDLRDICERFANLAVEHFADWCFVMTFEEPDTFTTVAAAHKDPKRVEEIREFQRKNATRRRPKAVVDALRGGATLIPRVTDEQIRAGATDEEHLKAIQSLEMHSAMVVPLQSPKGDLYGAITFVSAESRRTFTPSDLAVAERAAERAGAAIQNALVFDEQHRTTQRLRLLAKVTDNLFESLDIEGAFQRLAEIVVPEIADFALVINVDGDGLRVVGAAHRDAALSEAVGRLRDSRIMQSRAEQNLMRQLDERKPMILNAAALKAFIADIWPHLATDVAALAPKSGVRIPIHVRGKARGAVFVFNGATGRSFDANDLPVLVEIAGRTAIAMENAESYERERAIATTLQKASLPSVLPSAPDLQFDGVYTPTSQGASVGGDWYDSIALDDGSVMISVGDVAGSGLEAAVIMSKVRHVIAVGPYHESDPVKILDAADWILHYRFPDAVVTAFVGIISPDRKTIRFANAGHPSPLIRRGDELIELRAHGTPLGLRKLIEQTSTPEELALEPGDLIVLYTDGLTEWNHDIDAGERALHAIASSAAVRHVGRPARLIHDVCIAGESRDDVAVMTVALGAVDAWSFEAESALAAQDARAEFVEYLRRYIDDDASVAQAELVFGELMANIVQHAPGPVNIYVDWADSRPVIHAIDRGKGFKFESHLPDSYSESGRGLYLIRAACDSVHVERLGDYGNYVSATLRMRRS
ncbi:MAG TPA: SpoIIE family protein phosphatase [Candidatus Eremiobacteraceae bacterium]|nr:SpoIIE family protein phosphatase [Candidatus Eremiobacteraceae bacterium]